MSAPFTHAQTQTFLIDFGATNSYRGASQIGADANGNSWNSVVPDWYVGSLVRSDGSSSGVAYSPPSTVGVDSYNGPLGANVSNPLTSDQVNAVSIDSAALGILGGSKAAAADYMSGVNQNFQVKWLNQNLTYDATFYGAFMYASEFTKISAFAEVTYVTQLQSTTINVGGGGTYNSNTVAVLSGLKSTSSDELGRQIFFQFGGVNGGTGYLSSMALHGYLGYLDGSTTTLNAAPAAGYVTDGTYANGDSRSVDTVIGGGSTLNVNSADGVFYNSTLIMTNGGGSINAGTNFLVYTLAGSGNLALGGTSKLTLNRAGTYSGNLTLNGAGLALLGANAIGSGNLILNGGSIDVGNSSGFGTGSISVSSNTTTINNTGVFSNLTGNNAINLNGGWATLQVNGYAKTLNFGTGNVTVTGSNNLNAWNGGMQFDGVISGSGLINWYGGGTLVLGGANTFSGTVVASGNNGTLALAHTKALMSATLNMGTNHTLSFALSGNNTYLLGGLRGSGDIDMASNRLAISSDSTNTFSGTLSGANGLVFNGTGVQIFDGVVTYTGNTEVNGGAIKIVKSDFTAEVGASIVTIFPSNTPASGSTYTILNGPTIGNRSVVFSPGLNPSFTASFNPADSTVTVQSAGPTFSSWAGGVAMDSDADGNGMKALLEYALGATVPGQMDSSLRPSVAVVSLAGTNRLSITYYVRKGDASISVIPEYNTALAGPSLWTNDPSVIGVTTNSGSFNNSQGAAVEQRTASVIMDGTRKFLRLKATGTQ